MIKKNNNKTLLEKNVICEKSEFYAEQSIPELYT